MSPGPAVRTVRLGDAEAITRLLNPIIEAGVYSSMTAPMTVEDQVAFIRELPPRSVYLAAEAQGNILGVQDVLPSEDPGTGHVSTFVSLGCLRRGVGTALFEETLPAAKALGYHTLRAEIRGDNPGAAAFYRRFGRESQGSGETVTVLIPVP